MENIKIAIVGIGNCASSLIQGIHYYKNKSPEKISGLMNWEIGGYNPSNIEVVAAFDIDERKVNKNLIQAIFATPNCTQVFHKEIPETDVVVRMGKILDGYSQHMDDYTSEQRFVLAGEPEVDKQEVVNILKQTQAEIMINFLPVGSQQATEFYVECALEAGLGLINCIPVFIASNDEWREKFEQQNLPIIGDDIKAQLGATILHRTLFELFKNRGVKIERTYQLNTGGNTDFLNMRNQERLHSKKISKTSAVNSILDTPLSDTNIHVGPSDYVPWQKDNKICFLRMEGKLFGDVPMNLELRLSVEDSPNSAGVVIDAIRCCKLALLRKQGGVIYGPSAYFMKHPPQQFPDEQACRMTKKFIHSQ